MEKHVRAVLTTPKLSYVVTLVDIVLEETLEETPNKRIVDRD